MVFLGAVGVHVGRRSSAGFVGGGDPDLLGDFFRGQGGAVVILEIAVG